MIIMEFPGIYNYTILHKILYKALTRDQKVTGTYVRWVAEYDKERFQHLVLNLHSKLAEEVTLQLHLQGVLPG